MMNGEIVLTVKDDGIGFPANANEKSGMGLQIMQSRAQMIGGRVDFRNDVGGGVVVICSAPYVEHAASPARLVSASVALSPQTGM
jgi:signal transduction histidine kinase